MLYRVFKIFDALTISNTIRTGVLLPSYRGNSFLQVYEENVFFHRSYFHQHGNINVRSVTSPAFWSVYNFKNYHVMMETMSTIVSTSAASAAQTFPFFVYTRQD